MKNKVILLLVCFLLLVPFRLPISILMIQFFNSILEKTTSVPIPVDVMATNVILTKTVYNLAISCVFVYNIEMLSRQHLKRKPDNESFFYWTFFIALIMVIFIGIDANGIYGIFFKK